MRDGVAGTSPHRTVTECPCAHGTSHYQSRGGAQRGQVTHPRSHSGGPWHDIKPYHVQPQFPCSCHMEKRKRRPHRSRFDWVVPGTPCMDLRQIGSTTRTGSILPTRGGCRGAQGGSKQAWSQGVDLHVTCMPGWICSLDGGCRAGPGGGLLCEAAREGLLTSAEVCPWPGWDLVSLGQCLIQLDWVLSRKCH